MNHRNRMRRLAAATALAATAAIVLAGCSTGSADTTIEKTAPSELTGTVSFWHFFSDREGDVIQSVVDDFEAANPKLTVEVHAGQDDEKLRKAIAAGNDVDLGLSYSTDIVGSFCDSGAFRDLGPYIERDDVDLTQFSETVRSYTEFDGVRCSMPVLADVYGLYFLTIPHEYADAARLDGCSEWGVLWRVIIPMAKPGIAAAAIFMFFNSWNDYYGPLLYTSENEANWPVAYGLATFRGSHGTDWSITMAITILVMVPVVIIFFFAQRIFVEGITLTGVKG